jgi:MFS family permease
MIGVFGSLSRFFLLVLVALYFNTIESIFIARMLQGIFTSASLPTVCAYISDISSSEEKTMRFDLLGAMSGLGLTLGLFIGGLSKVFGTILLS